MLSYKVENVAYQPNVTILASNFNTAALVVTLHSITLKDTNLINSRKKQQSIVNLKTIKP